MDVTCTPNRPNREVRFESLMAGDANSAIKQGRITRLSQTRQIVKSTSWTVVVLVIGLGWRLPLLGFAVPVVMIMAIALSGAAIDIQRYP